eukprot:2160769-Prymnesium_polylepis.1
MSAELLLKELLELRGREAAEDVLLGALGREREPAAQVSAPPREADLQESRVGEAASTYADEREEDLSREQLEVIKVCAWHGTDGNRPPAIEQSRGVVRRIP